MRISPQRKWFVLRAVIVGEVVAFLASFRVWRKMNRDQGQRFLKLYIFVFSLSKRMDFNNLIAIYIIIRIQKMDARKLSITFRR